MPICADGRPFGTGRAVLFMDGLGLSRVEGHRRHLLFGLCVSEGVKQAALTAWLHGSGSQIYEAESFILCSHATPEPEHSLEGRFVP